MEFKGIDDNSLKTICQKLYESRIRIIKNHPFFGFLLMEMDLILSDEKELFTGATDGESIYINVHSVLKLSEFELDFVFLHELMHIILKHCFRGKELIKEFYNIAADTVINSMLFDLLKVNGKNFKLLGNKIYYLTPEGKEGKDYTAEQVYEMILTQVSGQNRKNGKSSKQGKSNKKSSSSKNRTIVDSHDKWNKVEETPEKIDAIDKKIKKANDIAKSYSKESSVPPTVRKLCEEMSKPKIDWRVYLDNFIQKELFDYSFLHPDKRYSESEFIMPDFVEDDDGVIKNIIFACDISSSMRDKEVVECLSEIKSAIRQYDGRISGKILFWGSEVVDEIDFDGEFDFTKYQIKMLHSTNPLCVFRYIEKNMSDNLPIAIIILTDGIFEPIKENQTLGIPLLWVFTTDKKPPFGNVIYIN